MATSESLEWVEGRIVLAGHTLSGDTIPFVPSGRPAIPLRLAGIDAPELAYLGRAQRLGTTARRALLDWLGFRHVAYANDERTVTWSSPASVSVTVAMSASSGYVLRPRVTTRRPIVDPDDLPLGATANAAMLRAGHAYYFGHASVAAAHRELLKRAARSARNGLRGVWAHDATARGFVLDSASALGPSRALVFPALFRKCVEFLRARARGFPGSLVEWIATFAPENVYDGISALPFSALVRQRHNIVALPADTLDLVFELRPPM